jgi:hypothetical protein
VYPLLFVNDACRCIPKDTGSSTNAQIIITNTRVAKTDIMSQCLESSYSRPCSTTSSRYGTVDVLGSSTLQQNENDFKNDLIFKSSVLLMSCIHLFGFDPNYEATE